MGALWIVITQHWSLSSVQASLNVVISVLGTVGLWAFTRSWWRRGCDSVLQETSGVPFHSLFSIATIGEGKDAFMVLRRSIFAKENWHLLLQLIVVVIVTLTCALAGPIAKVSLRNGLIITKKEFQVLPTSQGEGAAANMLSRNVFWNQTARSLDSAGFPTNQLLDFLPPSTTPPWIYIASEWDPTWTMKCNYVDDVILNNVTGSGVENCLNPVDAFSTYRDSFDSSWFDPSKYRMTSTYAGHEDLSVSNQMREAMFVTLIQSDPEIDDRMQHNNETIHLSISLLHASDFKVLSSKDTSGLNGGERLKPTGPIGHASYSRAECTITRKTFVENPEQIPWPWTNDTGTIVAGVKAYFKEPFLTKATKEQPPILPTAREIMQFYQVYMVSMSTARSDPVSRTLSAKTETVELSVIFLAILIFLTLLTAWNSIRYAIFLMKNKELLRELDIPETRLDWMRYVVKMSKFNTNLDPDGDGRRRDDELFWRTVVVADPRSSPPPLNSSIHASRMIRVKLPPSYTMSERPSQHLSVP